MIPGWLPPLATASLVLAFLCTAIIVVLLFVRPQKMRIMEVIRSRINGRLAGNGDRS